MWINSIGYSVSLSQKTFLADEISQKLNNPVSPYFTWDGSTEFHVLFEMQDNMICIYNLTKSFSDLCIFFFNLHSQFTIVWSGDMPHQKEIIHAISFPSWFLLVYVFAVRPFNTLVNVWHSVFKWNVNNEKICGLILWKLKFL